MTITAAQIKSIAGTGARSDLVSAIVRGWPTAAQKAKLTTRNRACHFLAQIMTETGGLRILSESGAYSAARISQIFGAGHHSAGITPGEARSIAALPIAQRGPVLFNRVYGIGNPKKMREFNNTGPNDGWLYRGGGMMQCTGKNNYATMAKKTGLALVEHPEMLHNPDSAFMAAYLEWAQDGRCNAAADRDDVVAVRKVINGGTNGLAECRVFLAKAKKVLADYSAVPPPVAVFTEPEPFEVDEPSPSSLDPVVVDAEVKGDPELYSVQKRLKAMNYNPGVLDGRWGGGTSGALSGFINDRGGMITVPASLDAFNDAREEIKAELGRAESESPPFTRPVSAARKSGDAATVAKVAPEVVPVKQNFFIALWGSIVTFFTAIWTQISDYVKQAWDWYTDNSDSGIISTATEYLGKVPTVVWLLAGGGALLWIALNSRSGVNKITQSVQTGERL
jgi:predicted chitinase